MVSGWYWVPILFSGNVSEIKSCTTRIDKVGSKKQNEEQKRNSLKTKKE
jgi:hypothetical protein